MALAEAINFLLALLAFSGVMSFTVVSLILLLKVLKKRGKEANFLRFRFNRKLHPSDKHSSREKS